MPSVRELPPQFGRYRILRKLGDGGMGAVYLAEDTQLGRHVALKVPHFTAADGPKVVERFQREARAAAAVEHTLLCRVYDVGQHDGVPYLTMEFVQGTPLSHLVNPDEPWEPRRGTGPPVGRGPRRAAPARLDAPGSEAGERDVAA